MLNKLLISNYALIRDLSIEFDKQFSVITGETGAGKSIILGALSLILGSRADNLTLPDQLKKCTIEGVFDISRCELERFFEENNLDYDTICLIRREITPQGKSRAFINDTPVNLNQIKDLTGRLIDVHSQHQTLMLRENSFQLSVVDAVAGNQKILKEYHEKYRNYQRTVRELEELKEQNQKSKTELDYLIFVVDEFRKTALTSGEQEVLEEELDIQTHAEDIKTRLYSATQLLSEDEDNVLRRLKDVLNQVNNASYHFADLKGLSERLDSCLVELKDIAEAIADSSEKISFSPERIEQLNERLNHIYRLEQKHHVKSVDELIALADEFEKRISGIESLDQQVEAIEKELKIKYGELLQIAKQLTDRRKKVTAEIERSILDTIGQLGIKDASFNLEWKQLEQPAREGMDEVRFLFAANRGSTPDDIYKIASGGELSRLMLAVKSLISTNNLLPTIVFDEIDTGISGDIAGKVGKILREISGNMQVIAITHLPQIAALSDEHYKVTKVTDKTSTWSVINKLNKDQQIDELALMISGDHKAQGARDAAMELLKVK